MMIFKASFVVLVFFVMMALQPSDAQPQESHAERYWKTNVGNNIPIPYSLKQGLQLGTNDETVILNMHKDERANADLWYYSGNYFANEIENELNSGHVPEDHRPTYFTTDSSFKAGKKVKIYFKRIDLDAKFLPYQISKSLAFKYNNLQTILNTLSINPKSSMAESIDNILQNCEYVVIKDERRGCVISLEGMVDFVKTNLKPGKNELVVANTEQNDEKVREYMIEKVERLGSDGKDNVVCHKINDPFVVYICHVIKDTRVYRVTLVGEEGKETKAIASCHMDTSSWNPKHRAFRVLNTKPGGVPVCHFINADSVAWVLKK